MIDARTLTAIEVACLKAASGQHQPKLHWTDEDVATGHRSLRWRGLTTHEGLTVSGWATIAQINAEGL